MSDKRLVGIEIVIKDGVKTTTSRVMQIKILHLRR